MKSLTNIEKLPGKPHYTGYANGVWHITRTASHEGWEARQRDTGVTRYGRTLEQISVRIAETAAKQA